MSDPTKAPASGPWPGDPDANERLARMIRVDQAGEYGAVRIYAGQMAVLGRAKSAPAIRHMAEQEKRHLEKFNALMAQRRVRPTVFQPIWHVAGFAMGAATALLGEKAAMACTVAVEEVIDEHYRRQAEALGASEPAVTALIEEARADEVAHRDSALEHGARETPGYEPLTAAVKSAPRLAIWLSERW